MGNAEFDVKTPRVMMPGEGLDDFFRGYKTLLREKGEDVLEKEREFAKSYESLESYSAIYEQAASFNLRTMQEESEKIKKSMNKLDGDLQKLQEEVGDLLLVLWKINASFRTPPLEMEKTEASQREKMGAEKLRKVKKGFRKRMRHHLRDSKKEAPESKE